jgi:hypothetical protein
MTDGSASIRGLMAIGLMICAFVLVLTNKLTAEQFTDMAKWIFTAYAGSKAITTAVASWAASPSTPAAPTTVVAVNAPDPHSTPTVAVPPLAKV